MQIILKISWSIEYCNGGYEFAFWVRCRTVQGYPASQGGGTLTGGTGI